jgi:Tfp pilus assembly protein FimV
VPTSAVPGRPVPPQRAREKDRRAWLIWLLPALTLVLGIAVGASLGGEDPTTSPAYLSLESELSDSQEETSELSAEVAEARDAIRRAGAEAEARIAEQSAVVNQRALQLDQREKDLAAREAALVAAEQAARAAPAPEAPVAAPAPPPAPAPAPAPASTYYENCTAARDAGAAPVRAGDPGYASHLDRDGDGVGCE